MVVVIRPRDGAGGAPVGTSLDPETAMLALAGGGTVMSAVAPDAYELRRQLDAAYGRVVAR